MLPPRVPESKSHTRALQKGENRGPGGLAFAVFWGVVLAACFLAPGVVAQTAPAGVDIVNRAVADYHDGVRPLTATSNSVNTRVLAVYGVGLTPPGTVNAPAYNLAGAPLDTLYCRFDLENLGNAPDSLATAWRVVGTSGWAPPAVIRFRDLDGDGRFDAGEDGPAFLGLAAGASTPLDVGVVVAPGALGDAFVEVSAASTSDPSAADASVVRITSTAAVPSLLHLGPVGNPRALPGGDGSSDDVTLGRVGYADVSYTFENDVQNDSPLTQQVEVRLPDMATLAPGVRLAVADSNGTVIARSPSSSRRYVIGALAPGSTQRFQVVVTSATGAPIYTLAPGVLSLDVTARSLTDTTLSDGTVDRLSPPQRIAPGAAVALRQTFHETAASAGDVVTLVVTVENITDSLRVDDLGVGEFVQPQLSFLSSPDFVWRDGRLFWAAGSLGGGESRTAVAKFVANSRVRVGKAKAVGSVDGTAESGEAVTAGPVVSSIRIESDVFGADGVILGDVFVDADGDGRRDVHERGVPNVAVYLESGEYAVTDSLGLFSLRRVFPGYRVARLDESGLPDGLRLEPGDARRPGEQLVHLLPGAHARVSFALEPAPAEPPAPEVPVRRAQRVSVQERVGVAKRDQLVAAGSLPSSHFGLGKADLGAGADRALGPVVAYLEAHPGWKLLVEGHTDNLPISTPEFPSNLELSIARAEAVRNYVVGHGVELDRVVVQGYGATRPVASNATIEGRRHNRRVELSYIPPGIAVDNAAGTVDVGATIRNLADLPDTYRATVTWEVTTSDSTPRDAVVTVSVPEALETHRVAVEVGDVSVAPVDGAYHVASFSSERPILCTVAVDCVAADTVLVADIGARVDTGDRTATIRPFHDGRRYGATTFYDVEDWAEPASPTAARADSTAARGGRDDHAVAFVEPAPLRVFTNRDRIRVRASVPLGTRTILFADGEAVPETRIGQRTIDVAGREEQIVWYAVRIRPGWNTLALESRLIDGTVATDTVRVALSAKTAAVTAARGRVLVPADGRSRERLVFEVTDALGLPVADGIVATVVQGEDLVDVADARPDTRGLQVTVSNGRVTLPTRLRNDTGRGTVAVECDGFRAATDVSFVSPRKPFFATGVVDLKLGAYHTSGDGSGEGVEDFHDGVEAQGDARVFVQGAMPHGVSVTARLDTRKRYQDPLLKDDDPDRQYPIYGDASSLHHAAPSQGGNFVSLDRGESFVRYGDFRTPFEGGEFLAYRRAATGMTSALVHDHDTFESFVTRTDFTTHQDEIPADGTSGFYYLTRSPVVEHSERIVVETRDRYQSERVLEVLPMVRNRDYTINYFDGSVLFKEPVASVDRDFNPRTVVATYEVATNDDAQYLYGARGTMADGERYRMSATAVARSGDGPGYALYGADGEFEQAGFRLSGEVARSDDGSAGAGNAFKLGAGFDNRIQHHELYLRRVDGDFNNPSFRGGSQELASLKAGFDSGLRLRSDVGVKADGFVHRLDRTGERKENLRAVATFRHPAFRFQAGARFARHRRGEDDNSAALSIVGVAVGDEGERGPSLSTVWEKNLAGSAVEDYPDRLKSRGIVPLGERWKLVAAHEYLTATGRAGSHQATAGVESHPDKATDVYTKYSMSRTAGDERMGAVTGLRHRLHIREGLSGMLGGEAYRSLSDRPDDEYVTVKGGLGLRKPESYVVEGQYEYRWQTRRTKHLVRFDAARQLREGFAALLKGVLSVSPDDSANDEFGFHSTLGVAHRPLAGAVHSLWMLRNDYERYTPANPDAITWRLVASTDVSLMPATDHEFRFKYAFKHVENWSYGASQTVNADLVLGQYVYRFARGWDADVWGRLVRTRDGGSMEAGSGVEVGRMFARALRIAAGYSVGGFEDPDFAGTDAWSSGFGVRLQLLVNERLFDEVGVTGR